MLLKYMISVCNEIHICSKNSKQSTLEFTRDNHIFSNTEKKLNKAKD